GCLTPSVSDTSLKEGADRLAVDPEADHLRAVVNLLDRLGRHEPATTGEEPGADRQSVRLLRRGSVHRALHRSDDTALRICDEEAGSGTKVDGECAHSDEA